MDEQALGELTQNTIPNGMDVCYYYTAPYILLFAIVILIMSVVFFRALYTRSRAGTYTFASMVLMLFFIIPYSFLKGLCGAAMEVATNQNASFADFSAGLYVAAYHTSYICMIGIFAAPMAMLLFYRCRDTAASINHDNYPDEEE